MSSAFTPGPWCVRDIAITHGRYIGPSADGGAPAVAFIMSRVNVPEAQLDADARLVASAPELLEALRLLMTGCEWSEIGGLAAWHRKQMASDAALTAARAAIARATGGTQ